MTMRKCPGEDVLRSFVAGGEVDERIRAHVATCPRCRKAVERLQDLLGLAGELLDGAAGVEDMPSGLMERLFAKVNPLWKAAGGGAVPRLAAQTNEGAGTPDEDEGTRGVHCLFVDPETGVGYVRPLFVRVQPAEKADVRPRVDCDAVMSAAVERAVGSVLVVLERLGFAGAAAKALAVEWWIEGPPAHYEGASVGLGAALAAAAAFCRVPLGSALVVTGAVDGSVVAGVAGVASKWRALAGKGFETFLLPASALEALPAEALTAEQPRVVGVGTLEEAIAAALGAVLGLARRDVAAILSREASDRASVRLELGVEAARVPARVRTRGVGVRPAVPPLHVGDDIRILVRANQDCHVSLVNFGSGGDVTVLLPNAFHDDTHAGAGTWHRFPAEGHSYTYPLLGPPGREKVIALASTHPLALDPRHFAQEGPFAAITAAARDLAAVTESLRGRVLGVGEIDFAVAGRLAGGTEPRTAGPAAAPVYRSWDLPA
jgi:Domain of unknown function (DUF4384)